MSTIANCLRLAIPPTLFRGLAAKLLSCLESLEVENKLLEVENKLLEVENKLPGAPRC